jgi:Zn-dependent M28 family amino/carboxypeptidase
VAREARQLGLDVKRATAPLNYSDHFPFVMKGVPALWIVGADDASASPEAREAAQRTGPTELSDRAGAIPRREFGLRDP